MSSKVYFTDFRTRFHGASLLDKIQRLMKTAGFESIDFKDKFVAIKMHFGEVGNLAFLRPNYAKAVADYVKQLGGKPFLTDCNTLYVGGRKNALEHLDTAMLNGFSPLSTGCQIIIADGLKGNDEVDAPVPHGEHFKFAKIGRAVMDADIIISLTHFKGHEKMGIGGVIKNIGMGCGSRAGKMAMHSDGKPFLDRELCIGCGICRKNCAQNALNLSGGKMAIDHDLCVGCGRCISACPKDALQATWDQHDKILDEKTAEYTAAVLDGKLHFHVSLLCDITPNCDCHGESDTPILPDIGILAGFDPVALDVAACDLCNRAQRLENTWLDDCPHGSDVFDDAHDNTHWRDAIDHAVKIGLGSDQYEMVTMPL
ncbi:MAG: DUF362 domain-containing protein [Victivallaceae bacterium]|nr:DUF362 domain-containing protein [Victivallaceae bacterium]